MSRSSPGRPALLAFVLTHRLDAVVLRVQSALGILVITPFSLWRIWGGEYLLAAVGLTGVAALVALNWFLREDARYHRWSRVLLPMVVLVEVVAITAMVAFAGSETKLWMYPVSVSAFFFLQARQASLLVLTGCMAQAWLAYAQTGRLRESAIFFATNLMVVMFTRIFVERLRADSNESRVQSLQDPLTHIGNRRLLDDAVTAITSLPLDAPNEAQVLILLDVDHFKSINDRFGHNVGDACLARLAALVDRSLDDSAEVYRYGGEEFVVLASMGLQEGTALAERIRMQVQQTPLIREAVVTVSAGVAAYAPGMSRRDWFGQADAALYRAKEGGRNQVVVAGS